MALQAKLTLLGTGNALVTHCYNTCFVLQLDDKYLLVDAGGGNGILAQLEKASLNLSSIHEMFITHAHTDHILGAVWVVRIIIKLMKSDKYQGNFTIISHKRALDVLETICKATLSPKDHSFLGQRIILKEVHDGQTLSVCGHNMSFFDIHSTKEKQFGFSLELAPSKNLVSLGDEPYCKLNYQYASKAYFLLSEAFCLFDEKEIFKPYEKHHSTVKDATLMAQELEVQNLVLYHTDDNLLSLRKARYTKEAQQYFKGNIFIPDDLESIDLI